MKIISSSLLLVLMVCVKPSSVKACITSESTNNNTLSSAEGPLCDNQNLSASINNRRDVDWYYFDALDGNISISLNHHSRDDFDWALFNNQGTQLTAATSSNVPETGSYTITNSSRYYLQVTRYRGSGWYDLLVDYNANDSGGGNDCGYGPRPAKPGSLKNWLSVAPGQSDQDICISLNEPAVLLMGGNFDVDEAFSLRVKPLMEGGDVVVLRTSGSDGYNDVLLERTNANSVETLIVDSRNKANSDYVEWAIKSAEFIWIAGGDQSDYLNQWKGTLVESALNHVIQKGGILGGTSAGNAIQGQFVYDPDGVPGIYSAEAVSDACHPYLNISTFLSTHFMKNIVTDTHFAERDRMGRLAVFMADIGSPITGVGVDEDTSIFIRADGTSVVDGDNAVYVLQEDSNSQLTRFSCSAPVIYENIRRFKLTAGDTFNFNTGNSSQPYIYLSIDGRDNNFYTPSTPY
ncbi:cyanophycinase [Aliikangiella marina]|uniref:Cyanophycinase n=1 Tax=Aliikangiella marina TaxID=1712262 RepID=A0A545THJ5_9GAMM|nr:Type 1 glutamine amidotransferase-like domain-containing protein [Aliikangiella marina]TQV76621.1 cyanophycinase [Aliikangiella marina]